MLDKEKTDKRKKMADKDKQIKIAVVGDVHDLWEPEDEVALKHLGVDLVLFVGDFGNEAVELVRAIAAVDIPKAAILGNHDAWYSATDWGRKKSPHKQKPGDRVKLQMDMLGEADVGYGKRDFPEFGLSVVGSRPFSWGGPEWKCPDFYRDRFGINSFTESTRRIVAAAESATCDTLIFLGHNGPTGLGDAPEDPCGRDWQPLGGDHGDIDLEEAVAQTRALGKSVPLVTFGHMHHKLRHTKKQLRECLKTSAEGTVYLNAASAPRIVQTEGRRLRNFSMVSLTGGVVTEASLIWVGPDLRVASEEILYRRESKVAVAEVL